MKQLKPIFLREFLGYFRSPVGYVFAVVFLLSSIGCMFFLGRFYDGNQASLDAFFTFHPWLFLVLVPAVGMRLWAEEKRTGTEELLFTLPITLTEAVIAKFLAGWAFIAVALALTFPVVLTVNYLGDPDNMVIAAGYLGSILMAGAYLSIACLTSALTKNQVISFILGVVVCFVMVLLGWGVFTDLLAGFMPSWAIDFVSSLGFITHYTSITRGMVDSRDILYFVSVVVVALSLNTLVLESRRAA